METTTKYNEVKKIIREKLIKGDIGKIAEAVKMTSVYVGRVLNSDEIYNDEIIAEAGKIIAERERKADAIIKQLS